jgi:Ca-activated chloride channel family protein
MVIADAEGQERELEGVRNVGQKTFFRRDKQWRDSSVTPEQQARAIRVVQFTPEYFELAASHGGQLAKYVTFEEPVLLNLDGKTYQIDPPKD